MISSDIPPFLHPDRQTFRGMAVFDLDGTLLRGETVCELLARPLGRINQMKQFEQLSSEADIAEARSEMVQWYRDHSIESLQQHLQGAMWAPGARDAVRELNAANVLVGIASITWKFAVQWFADQLGVRHYLGTDVGPDGEIIHVWGRDKAEWLNQLMASNGVSPKRVAAVGDSQGDFEMLQAAQLRFLVGKLDILGLPSTTHLPEADLRLVSEQILRAWPN
jgi:HAD superfamily phosphoserine phosphatase-like hydrolase